MSDHYAFNKPASTYLYYPLAEKTQLKDLRNQLIRRFLAQKINKEVFLIKKSANLKY